jgi:hypothetical protein
MNLHDSIRDLSIGIGGPVGGLIVAGMVSDPIIGDISVILGSLAALSVIIRNVIEISRNKKP